jgi:hypothetical protein
MSLCVDGLLRGKLQDRVLAVPSVSETNWSDGEFLSLEEDVERKEVVADLVGGMLPLDVMRNVYVMACDNPIGDIISLVEAIVGHPIDASYGDMPTGSVARTDTKIQHTSGDADTKRDARQMLIIRELLSQYDAHLTEVKKHRAYFGNYDTAMVACFAHACAYHHVKLMVALHEWCTPVRTMDYFDKRIVVYIVCNKQVGAWSNTKLETLERICEMLTLDGSHVRRAHGPEHDRKLTVRQQEGILMMAASRGQLELCEFLDRRFPDVDWVFEATLADTARFGTYPLRRADACGHNHIVQWINRIALQRLIDIEIP